MKYTNYHSSTTGADAEINGNCPGNYTFSLLDEFERCMHDQGLTSGFGASFPENLRMSNPLRYNLKHSDPL